MIDPCQWKVLATPMTAMTNQAKTFAFMDELDEDAAYSKARRLCQLFSYSLTCPENRFSEEALQEIWNFHQEKSGTLPEKDIVAIVSHLVKAMSTFAKA